MVTNILEYFEAHPEKQLVLIFIDTEKAFDNVKWSLLLEILKELIREGSFYYMIKAIYGEQEAKVIINSELTSSFKMSPVASSFYNGN